MQLHVYSLLLKEAKGIQNKVVPFPSPTEFIKGKKAQKIYEPFEYVKVIASPLKTTYPFGRVPSLPLWTSNLIAPQVVWKTYASEGVGTYGITKLSALLSG